MGLVERVFSGRQRTPFTRLEPSLVPQRDANAEWLAGRDWGWSSPSATGIEINQRTAMAVSTVMACVSIISEDVAKLKPEIFKRRPDGGRDVAKNHPLRTVLKRPNGWQTWYEFAQGQIASMMLRGNAYAVILTDLRGRPTMLVPVNPDHCQMWEAPDGSLFLVVTRTGLHQMAVLRDMPLFILYEDILHWKGLSLNSLVGLSKIALNREAIGLAAAMEQLAARAVGGGTKPSGTLETDQRLPPEVAAKLKAEWKQKNAGVLNSGEALILDMGLKFKPMTLNLSDLEFIAGRNYQNQDIARLWRIPTYMVGEEKSRGPTNITQASQDYLNNTLTSYIEVIEQRFGFTFDLDDDDYFVELDVSRVLRADIGARYAAYRIGAMGWLTTNEIRISEGLNPVEGGDTVFRPVNTAPLDSDVFEAMQLPGEGTKKQPGVGSEQTGQGGEGGGRPPNDGTDPAPAD